MTSSQRLAVAEIHVPPAGLRECVLRVRHLSIGEAQQLARVGQGSLWHRVARWRVEDPAQWATLLRVMGLKAFREGARES